MLTFFKNRQEWRALMIGLAAAGSMSFAGCQSCSTVPGSVCGPAGCGTGVCEPAMAGPGCNAPAYSSGCADGLGATGGYNAMAPGCGAEGCVDGGCADGSCGPNICEVPRELRKTALPEYRIEPPDVILIEAASNLRTASAPVLAGEPLFIQCARTLPAEKTDPSVVRDFKTINGMYVIGTDGYVNLGPEYGKVLCAGQPLAEIQRRMEVHLKRILTKPQVLVTLPDPTAKQVVAGPHLVRPDGTVGLGVYGSVFVAGKSLSEAKCAIEQHLSAHMHAPEVTVDVLGYNSKVYYVIADGGGAGEKVYRLPSTGNETVLDAVSRVNGLPAIACKGQIWIARPHPDCCRPDQVLHVDWDGIAQGAQTCTNYQLLPGDRLYVKADPFITFDTNLSKITAPFERILGLTILGTGVVRTIEGNGLGNNGGF